MSKTNESPRSVLDHNSDVKNPNKGTPGTNKPYDTAQGLRGKHMNPNWKGGSKKK